MFVNLPNVFSGGIVGVASSTVIHDLLLTARYYAHIAPGVFASLEDPLGRQTNGCSPFKMFDADESAPALSGCW